MDGPAPTGLAAAAQRSLSLAGETSRGVGRALSAAWNSEWYGSPLHRSLLSRPKPVGLAARPRDFRPPDPSRGRALMRGDFELGGSSLRVGPDGDPWDRPSPTYRLAIAMHRYDWAPDLLAQGEAGAAMALRLHLQWRSVFGDWNAFAWSPLVLERRVFNLACAIGPLTAGASDAEAAVLALDLARQARHLLRLTGQPERATERATVAAIAACALAGPAGERLGLAAISKLEPLLLRTVLPDGAHASRSPEAGLELLFDLLTLDDALSQRGLDPPRAVTQSIDRLWAALRFFTLGDGRLACFQGGEAVGPARVAAAMALDSSPTRMPEVAPNSGYHRLNARALHVIVDGGAPAAGIHAIHACAQPMALEVVCGRDRLITNCGWTPEGGAPQAFRLTDAASTLTVADASLGEPLSGAAAALMGPRLSGGPLKVTAVRQETDDGGVWLEIGHDGWGKRFGLRHERRLFLDRAEDQLRGEDSLKPLVKPGAKAAKKPRGRPTFLPFAVRFHLHPDARASVARDNKSVLIRGASNQGWWLRSDAPEVAIEPSAHFEHGVARRTTQVVLRGQARSDTGARVRWKLTVADG